MNRFTPKEPTGLEQTVIDGINAIPFGTKEYDEYRHTHIVPVIERKHRGEYVMVFKGEFDPTLPKELKGKIITQQEVEYLKEDYLFGDTIYDNPNFKFVKYSETVRNLEHRAVQLSVVVIKDGIMYLCKDSVGKPYVPKSKVMFSRSAYTNTLSDIIRYNIINMMKDIYGFEKTQVVDKANAIFSKTIKSTNELSVLNIIYVIEEPKAKLTSLEDMVQIKGKLEGHNKAPKSDYAYNAIAEIYDVL